MPSWHDAQLKTAQRQLYLTLPFDGIKGYISPAMKEVLATCYYELKK
jgi:hypothetical protein